MSTSAKVSIASGLVSLAAIALAWNGTPSTLVMPYEMHKLAHILGVVVFGGNLVVGPVWFIFAFLSRDKGHLAFAARALAKADIFLTVPGIQLTVWNGVFLATVFGGVRSQPWLVESMVTLVVMSVFSMALVLPAQEKLVRLCEQGADLATMKVPLALWSLWGTLVGVPLGLVLYLMVSKQAVFSG